MEKKTQLTTELPLVLITEPVEPRSKCVDVDGLAFPLITLFPRNRHH